MITTAVEKRWLTYREATAYSGLGRTRLWQLLKDSKIKGAKDGVRVRIDRGSLDEYLNQQDYASIVGEQRALDASGTER